MVIGEPQIFGQVKDAYRKAVETETAGVVFKSLFPQAFALVKKIRSMTDIGRANVSVSYAAVKFAKHALGEIAGKTIMILGAGEMAELTVRNLVGNGVKQVLVANRTFERAVRLAESLQGTPVMFYEIAEYIPRIDILISSLNSPRYVLKKDDLSTRLGERPLLMIDISVPRSINPDVKEIRNVHLYNIDDLKSVVEESVSLREKEAQRAVSIIEEKSKSIWGKLDSSDFAPVILALKNIAETIRQEDFESFATNTGFSDQEKGAVESLTKSIVNKITYHTIVKMREYTNGLRYK